MIKRLIRKVKNPSSLELEREIKKEKGANDDLYQEIKNLNDMIRVSKERKELEQQIATLKTQLESENLEQVVTLSLSEYNDLKLAIESRQKAYERMYDKYSTVCNERDLLKLDIQQWENNFKFAREECQDKINKLTELQNEINGVCDIKIKI